MKFRAEREEIYAQVLKDTTEVLGDYEVENQKLTAETSLEEVGDALREVFTEAEMSYNERDKLQQLVKVAKTPKEWQEACSLMFWAAIDRGYSYDGHQIRVENGGFFWDMYELSINLSKGMLNLTLRRYSETPTELFNLNGKASRVVGKLFGEKIVTALCTKVSMKDKQIELHFSKHYIPELYRMIAKDENCTSCMSKTSGFYGLPDDLHPVMAYEGSKNAALALLYDVSKGRYVGRSIVALGLHGDGVVSFSSVYGRCGSHSLMRKTGIEENDDMEGLDLTYIEYEGDFLLPYVDGNTQSAELYGGRLIVNSYGDYEANHATGRSGSSTFHCNSCCEDCEGEEHYTEDGTVCESCMEDYRWVDEEYVHYDNCVYCESDGEWIRERYAVSCDWNDEWYSDSVTTYELSRDSRRYTCTVVEPNLYKAIEDWGDVTHIDGEPVEQEEEAA